MGGVAYGDPNIQATILLFLIPSTLENHRMVIVPYIDHAR
jgi:hypothetical protein